MQSIAQKSSDSPGENEFIRLVSLDVNVSDMLNSQKAWRRQTFDGGRSKSVP